MSLSVRPYPVPGSAPAVMRPLLPWTQRHIARVNTRYSANQDDLWDEALTALLRAAVYYNASAGAFGPYGRTAVHRALARAVHVGQHRRHSRLCTVSLEDAGERQELTAPSAEAEAIARDALRRAWLLREHAAIAAARGDHDTTSRLRAAASAADRVARRPRRHSSPIVEEHLTMHRSSVGL